MRVTEPNQPRAPLAADVGNQVLVQLLAHLLSAVGAVLLVRHLSPHENGLLNVAWGIVGFGTYLTDFGLTSLMIRDCANASLERQRQLLWSAWRIRLMLALGLALLVWLGAGFVTEAGLRHLMLWLCAPLLLTLTLLGWFENLLVATGRIREAAWFALCLTSVQVLVGILVVIFKGRLELYALLQVLLTGGAALLACLLAWRILPGQARFERSLLGKLKRDLAAFGSSDLSVHLVERMPDFMLVPPAISFAQNGAFGAGDKIPRSLNFLAVSLHKTFFGRLCRAAGDPLEHSRLVLLQMRIGGTIAAFAAIGLSANAHEWVEFLWPNKWPPETALTLSLISCLPFVQSLHMPLGSALSSQQRHTLRAGLHFAYALLGLLGFLVLPKWWGLAGAAVAVMVCDLALLLAMLVVSRPVLRLQAGQLILRQMALLLLCIWLTVQAKPWFLLPVPIINALLAAGFGGVGYAIGSWLVEPAWREQLRQFFKRQNTA